jgi:hypothetical protein
VTTALEPADWEVDAVMAPPLGAVLFMKVVVLLRRAWVSSC